jgi:phosphohistidine phosphatase
MRELMLFRHAKSAWDVSGIADFDRALAARGERTAPAMARHLKERDLLPDAILCSASLRTRLTLQLLMKEWHEDIPVTFERKIYEAAPMAIIACLGAIDDDYRRVMVIGHNPGLQELALYLLKNQSDPRRALIVEKFPTAALAMIRIDTKVWSSIVGVRAELMHFIRPRDLEEQQD